MLHVTINEKQEVTKVSFVSWPDELQITFSSPSLSVTLRFTKKIAKKLLDELTKILGDEK